MACPLKFLKLAAARKSLLKLKIKVRMCTFSCSLLHCWIPSMGLNLDFQIGRITMETDVWAYLLGILQIRLTELGRTNLYMEKSERSQNEKKKKTNDKNKIKIRAKQQSDRSLLLEYKCDVPVASRFCLRGIPP